MLLSIAILCFGSCTKKNEIGKPVVETVQVIGITENSALGRGIVKSDGGDNVTERGVCWSIEHDPTISSNHVSAGDGLGEYTCRLTQLESNTTYYLRAYAINSAGEAYGNEIAFSTVENNNITTLPTIKLRAVEDITDVSAVCHLELVDNGGADIIDCGICWSEEPDPLLINEHESIGPLDIGSVSCQMRHLIPETTYFVRAYATNNQGTSYSSGISFITNPSPIPIPLGAIGGVFSVSEDLKVFFSKGNLQYHASSNTWRFADNQWDYVGSTEVETGEPSGTVIGSSNHLVSSTYNGWIDLFGWGTSGFDHGAICYQPWSTSEVVGDYYAYGSYSLNLYDEDGFADWGSNQVSNGDNSKQWRVLTQSEWDYVFNTRITSSGIRFAKAIVNSVYGVILLPDNWNSSVYTFRDPNKPNMSFRSNSLTREQWIVLESYGAVFFPASGNRHGTLVRGVSPPPYGYRRAFGNYWASTYSNSNVNYVNCMYLDDENVLARTSGGRYYGSSVRLICPIR